MPTPPQPNETHEDFMSRCMDYMAQNHGDKPQDQRVAICMSMYRRAHPEEERKKVSQHGS